MSNYFRLCLKNRLLNFKLSSFLQTQEISIMPRKSKSRQARSVPKKQPCVIPTELTGNFEVLPSPVKSYSDKKDYRVIRLENGLTACLISDKDFQDGTTSAGSETDSDSSDSSDSSSEEYESELESDESTKTAVSDGKKLKKKEKEVKLAAAALCVGVGSFSDPKEVPGLAHFLEHMVFMGSEKFPKENEFDSFVKKHGGSDNASTDYEVTTFYFECFEKYLYQSLDKFAQFFISPLMNKDSMTRERESIESEFQLALPSDEHRKEQLLVSMALDTSPVNSFSWGNMQTLKDDIEDDKLYEILHAFRKRHYSSHRMTLAIQSRLPLETLERYVVNCFTNVPNNGLPGTNFNLYTEEIFNTPKFNKIYYVKPIKDICQVELTWIMPPLQKMYKTKPLEYILWLIAHESKGSLFSYLKEKVWALSLTGDSDDITSSIYTHFSINILLTSEGLNHLDEVIEAVFGYIQMLKDTGPDERIFNELQLIEEISFRYEEDEDAVDTVEDLAECMQIFPPEDYLTGSELFFEYDPEAITEMLGQLTPEKLNIMVFSKKVPSTVTYDSIEPWFKTEYTSQDFPAPWMKSWKSVKPLPCFKVPDPNPFITTDFSLLPVESNIPDYPEKILSSSLLELWYRKDQKFNFPTAHYYYYFITPLATQSAESSCMLDLFVVLFNINLAEEGYDAQLAELSYDINPVEKGILIKIIGYNEKLPVLIDLIANKMKTVSDNLCKEVFEAVKEKQSQSLHNRFLKPSALCRDLRLSILQKNFASHLEKYEAIKKITFESMVEFSKTILNNFYLQALVQGNVTSSTAIDSTNNFINIINFGAVKAEDIPKIPVNVIPNGEYCCRVMSFNKQSSNSVITNYYQCGIMTLKDNVILELIMYLLEEPLFDILRTKEQLGYDVSYSIRDTYGVLGYSITVHTQANKFKADYVDTRIEAFLEKRYKNLRKMNSQRFAQTKNFMIQLKNAADVDLEDEVSRNWYEIVNRQYIFDRFLQEILLINGLQAEEVKSWWYRHNVFNKENTFKKISFQVVGYSEESAPDSLNIEGTLIENSQTMTNLVKAGVIEEIINNDIIDHAVEEASRHTITEQTTIDNKIIQQAMQDQEASASTTDEPTRRHSHSTVKHYKLNLLEDSEEVKSKHGSYFIKDIRAFKSKLSPYNNSG